MGVQILDFNKYTGKMSYSLVPESVPIETINELKELKKENMRTNGFSKGKTMRHIGSIPYAVLYNYALSNGVPVHKMNQYYAEGKGKNVRKLLKDVPACMVVDKL